MGLLGKTLDFAKKATSVAIDSANRKLDEAKQKRLDEERSFLQEFPYKNRCTIKLSGSYDIYDTEDCLRYSTKGFGLMEANNFWLTSPDGNQYCKFHKTLFNIPSPFTKDKKACSLEFPGKELVEIETYISFKVREYSISGNNLSIKVDEKEKEFRIFKNNNTKPDIHIYKVWSGEGFLKYEYYVGFDNPEDELLAVSLTIGIDAARFSGD